MSFFGDPLASGRGNLQRQHRSNSASTRSTRKAIDWLATVAGGGPLQPSPVVSSGASKSSGGAVWSEVGTATTKINERTPEKHSHRCVIVRNERNATTEEEPQGVVVERLERIIEGLRADLHEREWATKRAAELGVALDVLTEENAALVAEVSLLRARAEELDALRKAQQVLLAIVDEGVMDPRRLHHLLTSSDSFRDSCNELQDACKAISRWGPSSCPSCLATKEERSRAELVLKETASWQSISGAWEAMFATHRYCTAQCSESEVERMWQEDMLAHHAAVARLQTQLNCATRVASRVSVLEDEVKYWKHECSELSSRHSAQLADLRDFHARDAVEIRRAAIRGDPHTTLLRLLLVSGLKTFHAHGKLLFSAAVQRKHLVLLKHDVAQMGAALAEQLKALEVFCMQALRRVAPQEWRPVPAEDAGSPSRGRPQSNVHPPVLSAYARNAIVVTRPLPLRPRSESASRASKPKSTTTSLST